MRRDSVGMCHSPAENERRNAESGGISISTARPRQELAWRGQQRAGEVPACDITVLGSRRTHGTPVEGWERDQEHHGSGERRNPESLIIRHPSSLIPHP